jgi:hypothetical protein
MRWIDWTINSGVGFGYIVLSAIVCNHLGISRSWAIVIGILAFGLHGGIICLIMWIRYQVILHK